MRPPRAARGSTSALLPALAALLLLAGCFEEPVRDELTLRFLPGNPDATSLSEITVQPCEIELVTRIQPAEGQADNPVLEARLAERRRAILTGEDGWAARFRTLAAQSRHAAFDWRNETLREARQLARVELAEDPDALARFFGDTLVAAEYRAEDGWAELSLAPYAAGRATRRQRQIYDRAVGPWSDALATYFEAASALYSYLDLHPGRARVTLGVLLADVLEGEDEQALRDQLRKSEQPLVDAVEDAMDEAAEILVVDDGEAYSINELSRLLYDPFPAHVRVIPGGRVIETEGFAPPHGPDGQGGSPGRSGDDALEIPGFSLWEALETLEGQWLQPDPLLLYVRLSGGITGEPAPELTLDQIAAQDRFATTPPPSADEIRAAVEQRLQPEPLYRVVWAVSRAGTP